MNRLDLEGREGLAVRDHKDAWRAVLLWVHDQPLVTGRRADRKLCSAKTTARSSKAATVTRCCLAFAVTPYGAVQSSTCRPSARPMRPAAAWPQLRGAELNRCAHTELGARFDNPTLLFNKPLILFAPGRTTLSQIQR